jgi:hypothetical protein
MADVEVLYPPPPPNVPRDLAKPGIGYRLRVALVLAALFLFLLVYAALMGAGLIVLFWAIFPPEQVVTGLSANPAGRVALWVIRVGLGAISALFFVFLLKGLFQRRADDPEHYVEITAAEQPRLFEFIGRLCGEIGCTAPRRVCVSHEVNAAVFYPTSIANLVVPPARSLHIGLGLVNILNVVEFKAVLAHEFGHFSQRTLWLTGYVAVAHQIIWNMLNMRDRWDLWMVRGFDAPIVSVFIVPLYMIVEWTRQGLCWMFRGLDLAYLSLSRQMEFNADLVAAGAAGSDAHVSQLLKGLAGQAALEQAARDLYLAAEHRRYTRDLFYHQQRAAKGQPPCPFRPGPDPVIPPDTGNNAGGRAGFWSTHPSHHERERNVKRRYLPSPEDERSSWLLFDDPDAVRREVTLQYYWAGRRIDAENRLSDAAEVQAFLDEERQARTFNPRYRGIYDNRYLVLPAIDELEEQARRSPTPAADALAHLFSDTMAEWTAERLRQLDAGGQRDAEEDRRILEAFDRRVFALHYPLAVQQGQADLYRQRYAFHLELQQLLACVWDLVGRVDYVLNFLQTRHSIHVDEIGGLIAPLLEVRDTLSELYARAETLVLPPLKDHTPGERLCTVLPPCPDTASLGTSETALSGQTLAVLHDRLLAIADRLSRLHAHSLNAILKLHEELAAAWSGGEPSLVGRSNIPDSGSATGGTGTC